MKITDTTLPDRPAVRPPPPVAKPQVDAQPRPAWPRLVSRQGPAPVRARTLLERAERAAEKESAHRAPSDGPAPETVTAATTDATAKERAVRRGWLRAVIVFIAVLTTSCAALLALTFTAW